MKNKIKNERRSVCLIFIVLGLRKSSISDGYGRFGISNYMYTYRGADKSLDRLLPDVFCLMVRIFRLMLVLFYIYK